MVASRNFNAKILLNWFYGLVRKVLFTEPVRHCGYLGTCVEETLSTDTVNNDMNLIWISHKTDGIRFDLDLMRVLTFICAYSGPLIFVGTLQFNGLPSTSVLAWHCWMECPLLPQRSQKMLDWAGEALCTVRFWRWLWSLDFRQDEF